MPSENYVQPIVLKVWWDFNFFSVFLVLFKYLVPPTITRSMCLLWKWKFLIRLQRKLWLVYKFQNEFLLSHFSNFFID